MNAMDNKDGEWILDINGALYGTAGSSCEYGNKLAFSIKNRKILVMEHLSCLQIKPCFLKLLLSFMLGTDCSVRLASIRDVPTNEKQFLFGKIPGRAWAT
jgi:hypothetical protein